MSSSDSENDYYSKFDEDKNMKLHQVAAHDNLPEVNELLEMAEVKVDAENFLGWTPLMMATRNGNFEVVKLLIQHKADATKRNFYGCSVFSMAIASGNMDVIHFILQHLLQGGVSKQSMEIILSPITVALLFQQEPIIDYLLKNSFNVNTAAPISRITPIMMSAMLNNENLFQLLISKGADPFIKNLNNQSAYEIMCSKKTRKSSTNQQPQQQQQQQFYVQITHNDNQNELHNNNHSDIHNNNHTYNHNQAQNRNINHPQSQVHLCPQQHRPVFFSPPCHNTPVQVIYLTPPPNFCTPHSLNHHPLAKSSNVSTPPYYVLPPSSPITPMFGQQVFFPQNFTPNALLTPTNPCQSFTFDDVFCANLNRHVVNDYDQST